MKLLFDENISYRILNLISDKYPGSLHASQVQNEKLSDLEIWSYAKENNFIIVTYDEDFYEWQLLKDFPPKVVWLRFGNSKTDLIAKKLIDNLNELIDFENNQDIGIIETH